MEAILGIIYHAIGGFAAGSFYIPYSKVKNWAWEVYWLVGGFFAWILMPFVTMVIAVPNVKLLFNNLTFELIFWPYIFGIFWGIGGITFGLTMRYLGVSLGMAIALGLAAAFGTMIPPIYYEQISYMLNHISGQVTVIGVIFSLIGIMVCGKAGILKNKELDIKLKQENIKEFNFKKGIVVALFAGVMSASFAFGITAGKPITELAKNLEPQNFLVIVQLIFL